MALEKNDLKTVMKNDVVALYRRNKIKQKFYGNDPEYESYCPVCGQTSYFMPFGNPPRQKARCASCGSMERHRLLWLFFKRKTKLFEHTPCKILHVAAEPCFESRFRELFGENYITADLYNPGAMVKMDITCIQYPDESFDVVICSHVLEHVPDDRKAMGEFYRVLKKEGWAVLLVPIADMDKTYEDFSIITEAGRLEAFGQGDHVRKYGRDYKERIKSAGFKMTVVTRDELASDDEVREMSLKEDSEKWGFSGTEVFYCIK